MIYNQALVQFDVGTASASVLIANIVAIILFRVLGITNGDASVMSTLKQLPRAQWINAICELDACLHA